MIRNLAIVRGGGDIATGTIYKLAVSGFQVVILEIEQPTVIRRTVAFAQAIYDGEAIVEKIKAEKVEKVEDALEKSMEHIIPILVDPLGDAIYKLKPEIVIDAMIAKRNLGTRIDMAQIVIGLGPGFSAGKDVHAVVETNRGHNLGRVIYEGCAEPNTGNPGMIEGYSTERLIRAPSNGTVRNIAMIGEQVKKGQLISYVGNSQVLAPLDGILRGLIQEGITVTEGYKIGDVDPRNREEYCFSISDKARAVAGGALEAVLSLRLRV